MKSKSLTFFKNKFLRSGAVHLSKFRGVVTCFKLKSFQKCTGYSCKLVLLFSLFSFVRDATVAMIISFSLFVFPSQRPRIYAADGSGELA